MKRRSGVIWGPKVGSGLGGMKFGGQKYWVRNRICFLFQVRSVRVDRSEWKHREWCRIVPW